MGDQQTKDLVDEFRGDDEKLLACARATLALDADKALAPHGLSNNTRKLLSAFIIRFERLTASAPVDGDLREKIEKAIRQGIAFYQTPVETTDAILALLPARTPEPKP